MMLKMIDGWLATPKLADAQKREYAALINALLLRLFGVVGIAFLGVLFLFPAKLSSAMIVASLWLLLLGCKVALNRGNIQLTRFIFVAGLFVVSTALVILSGGTSSVNMVYYIAVIVMATLLYGRQSGEVALGVTLLTTLVVAFADLQGWLPPRIFPVPPYSGWFMLCLAALLVYTSLKQALNSRDRAQTALRDSEARYRSLFNAESNATIVMDKNNGLILDVNSAAEKLYGYSCQELIGKSIMDISAEPEEIGKTIRVGAAHVPLCYHKRRDGSIFPVEILDTIIQLGEQPVRIASVRNISERITAQQREQDNSRRLAGIIAAAQQLIECTNLDDVYRRAVELGRVNLGVERCAIFLLDEKKEELIGTYGTDRQGRTTDEHAANVPLPNANHATSGDGWRIHNDQVSHWEAGHPIITEDHWTAATYIRSLNGPVGVFFNDNHISNAPLDRSQQEAIAVYCSLLGSIIEQKLAEARRDQVSQGLRAIISATDELVRCEDVDKFYRRAVELGREKLGLERCALFLLDDDLTHLIGTYGTDKQGQTSDERDGRVEICENERILDAKYGVWQIHYNTHSHIEAGQQIYTDDHWHASTLIQSVSRPLGVFFNEANLSHQPVDEILQETVAVYCSLLGNIIERKNAELYQQEIGKGLRAVIEAADELIGCPELDAFYHRAVAMARQKLGVERCGLFVYDNDDELMHGTYGTNIEGQIVDESHIQWPTSYQREIQVRGNKTWYMREGEHFTLEGDKMVSVGQGWVAKTVLRQGDELIGLFANDNAISHAPVDPLQQEIVVIYCSLLENIIKQKRYEAAIKRAALTLRSSEERYRQAIEAAGAVPYLQDYDEKTFTFIGENIFQLTGYSADEMTLPVWDALVEEAIPGGEVSGLSRDEVIALVWAGKISQWQCDYRIRTRFDQSRWIMDSAVEIFDEHGIPHGAIGILQDITERKQTESERENLITELEAKNAELERFTYTVSHDLKSPLITIQGFLGYLQKDAEQGNLERLRADMARITDATVRMQHLLNDLLELSRIGRVANPPKNIPFEWIVNEALSLVKGQLDRGHVKVMIDQNLPFVYGDSARLVEVIQNLVDNAAKFMQDQENPQIEIGWQSSTENGYHVFFVRDNGIGIPSPYHERIFGLFNKLDPKSEGTGVGLALVKRIIEVHGGRIWLESDGAGTGSAFYFTLPGKALGN